MPPSRASTGICLLLAVAASAPAARAAVRRGGTGLTEDDKPVSLFAGLSAGYDTNVRRATADAESDLVTQLLAGVALTAGNPRSRADVRAEYRYDLHAELSELDFDETRATLAAFTGTDSFQVRLTGAHETLVDPTDFEVTDLLERTRVSYAPAVDFTFGKLGLGFGYSAMQLDYAEAAYDRLDLEQEVWTGELRWLSKRARQVFVHFQAGDVDYLDVLARNFEWQRTYLGYRAESARKAGIEVAVGTDVVDKFDVAGELYALARGTVVLRGGRTIVDLAATHGTEAAADADFKRATRLLLRYTQKATRRLSWMVALAGENDDIYHPTVVPDPLKHVSLDAGLDLELGSPGKTHGRFFVTLRYESRLTPVSTHDYDRLRILGGVALVH